MTVNDVINELRTRLNDDTINEHGEYNDVELVKCVNLALNEFCERTKCYVLSTTAVYDKVNGLTLGEINKPISVVVTTGNGQFDCQRTSPYDLLGLYDTTSPVGDPRYYTYESRVIKIFPVPTDSLTITVRGYGVRSVNSKADELEFLSAGDYPWLMKLSEIYARSTRQNDDDNRYMINHYRDQIEQYYQMRGQY